MHRAVTSLINLLQIAYDKGVLKSFNNSDEEVKTAIESLLVHVQTAYCHSSLGSQLTIERIGDLRLGIQIRNMKIVFNIYGNWHRVMFEKIMMNI